jgi:antitoxin HicB
LASCPRRDFVADWSSRWQLDRLLDPESDAVTLKSLMRAARLVGKKIKIDLVDAA